MSIDGEVPGSYMSACGADRLTPPRPNLRKSPAGWFTPSREGETNRPVAIVEVHTPPEKDKLVQGWVIMWC